MSTHGQALKDANRRQDEFKQRTQQQSENLARAKAQWERREARRVAQHQAMLKAAFYERHPELAA